MLELIMTKTAPPRRSDANKKKKVNFQPAPMASSNAQTLFQEASYLIHSLTHWGLWFKQIHSGAVIKARL